MTCGIYMITNLVNGKKYIGQSICIERRFREHCNNGKYTDKSLIDTAIQKYGVSNFRFDILEVLPENNEILDEKERLWIKYYNTYENHDDYNLTDGGMSGRKLSEETKNKLSKINTGKKLSPETRKKIGQSGRGKKWSEESKKRFSEKIKGKNHHNYGKPPKLETKLKLSKKSTTSGIFRVFKDKQKKAKGGFLWKYRFRENKKSITLISTDLIKLKKKVISKGYDWIIIDEEKAKQSFNENSLRNMS